MATKMIEITKSDGTKVMVKMGFPVLKTEELYFGEPLAEELRR